jgi:alanine transaminase
VEELERSYQEASKTTNIRALCVINPGNPTGQVLSKENIEAVIRWAYDKKIFILADEVYQDNIYAEGMKFNSFKKAAHGLPAPYNQIEIASFYSVSKGYMGECGARSGFMEIINMKPEVQTQLEKLSSASLCASVVGMACMGAVVNPPKPGEPSYEQFIKEKNGVLNGLKEKAKLVTDLFNSIEGIECNPVQGAMYAFPKISIPKRACEKARSLKMEPDFYYCYQLLESTGICVVPGSGFLQRPDTFHFRTTILPPIDQIKLLLTKFKKFHLDFINEWKD